MIFFAEIYGGLLKLSALLEIVARKASDNALGTPPQ